jgi:hypothetical protein
MECKCFFNFDENAGKRGTLEVGFCKFENKFYWDLIYKKDVARDKIRGF